MDRRVLMAIKGLVECRFLRRLNRFAAEIRAEGRVARAFLANSGRLVEFTVEGKPCLALPRPPGGKTRYRLVGFRDLGGMYALVDTWIQVKAFEKAVAGRLLPWLSDCVLEKREPRVGSSRLDYLFRCPGGPLYVETKSAVLRSSDGAYAMYPDCPTERGRRHMAELEVLAARGVRAMVVFIAALPRVEGFRPYVEGDPLLYMALKRAVERGVEVRAFSMHLEATGEVVLERPDLRVVI